MEERIDFKITLPQDVIEINKVFKTNGFDLFLVGGSVRDAYLGEKPKDWDLATNAIPDKVIEILKNQPFVTNILETGKSFGVINVITENDEYEITTFRTDIYNKPNLDDFKNYLISLNNGSYEKLMNNL